MRSSVPRARGHFRDRPAPAWHSLKWWQVPQDIPLGLTCYQVSYRSLREHPWLWTHSYEHQDGVLPLHPAGLSPSWLCLALWGRESCRPAMSVGQPQPSEKGSSVLYLLQHLQLSRPV